jgi:hypothetical protein
MIMPTMEMSRETNNLVLSREGARYAQRKVCGFGPRHGEAHSLGARYQLLDQLGPLDLERMASSVMHALFDLLSDRFDNGRVIVAQDQCAVAAEIIDVLATVDVPFARACRPFDINRVWL